MKVTIDFGDELKPAIEEHLETGITVQSYIKAAMGFFNFLKKMEATGTNACGYGHKSNFERYNTVVSPKEFLNGNAKYEDNEI